MDVRLAIEERRGAFVTAFNREDLTALADLCAVGIAMMPPNQPIVVSVEAALEWWRAGFMAGRTQLRIEPLELYVASGWALDWFEWTVTVVPVAGGPAHVDRGMSVWLWRTQHDARWAVARAMWISTMETPSLWAGGVADFPIDDLPLLM